MAKVKTLPAFVLKLKDALANELKSGGIQAEVSAEPVPTTKLFRVTVLAPKFRKMGHFERQDLVWRIAEKAIPDDQLRISMILTLSDDEM